MIIDAHCHIGDGIYKSLHEDELLASMDTCGIGKAVIVPVEECIAVDNEAGNNRVLAAMQKTHGRLIGFAVANPWYGQRAVDMVRKYLDLGMRGVKLHPAIQGFMLNDSLVRPIVEAAGAYRVPVYFHTGTPIHSQPLMLRDLASHYPEVNFIMGHMGAHDFNYDIVDAAAGLGNIYLETSMSLSDIIGRAIREVGADKVIFGSNMPRSRQIYERDKVISQCRTPDERDLVLSQNILRLVGDGQ